MQYKEISLENFADRKQQLKQVIRYHPYTPMFYRTNLFIHSTRVLWILEELAHEISKQFLDFDVDVARCLALIHDDPEIITGDIQEPDKRAMTGDVLHSFRQLEQEAIEQLAQQFPEKIHEFNYKDLSLRYHHKHGEDLEAVAVKYADILDGFGKALHELYAGNTLFTTSYRERVTDPVTGHRLILLEFFDEYPRFAPLLNKHPLFTLPSEIALHNIVERSTPHTHATVTQETENPYYDWWKRITLECGGDMGLRWLTNKIE